jgi:flagellar L-ring protein precursor FlgH
MTKQTLLLTSLIVCILALGCEPRHIRPYTPRHRQYDPGQYADDSQNTASPGSVWKPSNPSLFEDLRASRVGDILTVIIDEQSKGEGDATTQLSKNSEMDTGVTNFLGLMTAIGRRYPDMDAAALLKFLNKSDFSGEGATSRSGKLEGRIAVRVRQVLPNGDLFIEGHKVILLNEEELHFYVSGVVRQLDVSPENSLRSSLIADAQVEFSGRGVVADQQKQGWLHRLLNKANPI